MDKDILRSDRYDVRHDRYHTETQDTPPRQRDQQQGQQQRQQQPSLQLVAENDELPGSYVLQGHFSGDSREYTLRWLLNALLVVGSIGLFLPWAMAFNRSYLYRHTYFGNYSLQYQVEPVVMLLRAIGFTLLLLVIALMLVTSAGRLLAVSLSLVLIPWMINRAIAYRLSMTSYNNTRLSFHGTGFDTLINFFLVPLLALLPLGSFLPYWLFRLHKYLAEASRFGEQPIRLNTDSNRYLLILAGGLLLGVLAFILLSLALVSVIDLAAPLVAEMTTPLSALFVGLALILSGYFTLAFIQSYLQNHVINELQIGEHIHFKSDIQRNAFIRLMLENALLMVITAGFAYPATQIRKRRFLIAATRVYYQPD